MSKIRVLGHVGAGTGRHRPFDQVYKGSKLLKAEDIDHGADIDALVIWGGADISPTLYNHRPSPMCGAGYELSERDEIEAGACLSAIERGIPIIGVCRGAQLLCALAGGSLIQHVTNHGRTHNLTTNEGEVIATSSVHHQMMYPFEVEHELLAWSSEKRSTEYHTATETHADCMKDKKEPEIVWFPQIKGLAIQGHPEFHSDPENDPFVQHCIKLVQQYIIDGEA